MRLPGVLALVLTLFTTAAFPVTPPAAKPSGPRPEKVMIYGDSLSAAYGLDPREGWVTLLEKQLKPDGVAVVNSSISGETTLGGLSRINTDLARLKPTLVVLALGANDGLRGLPVAQTKKNLQEIIKRAQGAGARVILVGIQIPPNYGLEYAQEFRDLYAALAKENKLPLVPFLLEGIADNLDLFQADRLHPKASAQQRILENVLPVLRKSLRRPA